MKFSLVMLAMVVVGILCLLAGIFIGYQQAPGPEPEPDLCEETCSCDKFEDLVEKGWDFRLNSYAYPEKYSCKVEYDTEGTEIVFEFDANTVQEAVNTCIQKARLFSEHHEEYPVIEGE